MRNKLQIIFNPTKEERQEMYDRTNAILKERYEKYGECCLTCKHSIGVQASYYYDYTTCEFDRSLEFGYGYGSEKHKCEKYEFRGYLEVEEKASEN